MFSKLSGCQNRKRKAKSSKEAEASAKLIYNSVNKNEHSEGQELQLPECRDSLQTETGIHEIVTNIADETYQEPVSNSLEEQENGGPSLADVDVTVLFPLKDLATWPTYLNPSDRDCSIADGPFSPYLERYPKDGTMRSFYNSCLFIPLDETAQIAVQERFEQLKAKMSKVEFLFKLDELPKKEDLLVECKDLEDLLSDGDDTDIKGADLYRGPHAK
ncbi:hypothetical protein JTB14_016526 [Gonioctena quinquepunctata]|nr:hypothetical protein JTB14_016526 [Gonioctena quinquepunctata]